MSPVSALELQHARFSGIQIVKNFMGPLFSKQRLLGALKIQAERVVSCNTKTAPAPEWPEVGPSPHFMDSIFSKILCEYLNKIESMLKTSPAAPLPRVMVWASKASMASMAWRVDRCPARPARPATSDCPACPGSLLI